MKSIDHVGIAVKNLEIAEQTYIRLLGMQPTFREYIKEGQLSIVFFEKGESSVELIYSNDCNHAISKFIQRRGEGLHHMAYGVEDIYEEINRLKKQGFDSIENPKRGSRGRLIAFVHPKTTSGVLIELCQSLD